MALFYQFFIRCLSGREAHAPGVFPPHALFKWRVRRDTVAGNCMPEAIPMRRRVVFLPRWRVSPKIVRGRGGGRLKPSATFLSLLHVNVQESPPLFVTFHFGHSTLNLFFGHDFCYISFDLVRLGPPILIN